MALRPEIFLSAVSPELSVFRKAVKHALLELGARPVEHTDFSIEYGSLQGVLAQEIGKCDAVIHLAGFDYGQEPLERTLHAPRRSFAHYEVDVARQLGKPLHVFMRSQASLPFGYIWDEADKLELQQRHRSSLARGVPAQEFSTPEELARMIRQLRTQIIVRRSLARLPMRPMGPRFVGRQRVMDELAESVAPGRVVVLHPPDGLGPKGGQGKSCMATELAWRLHDERRFDFVLWIPAGPQADLEVNLAALARADSLALLPDEVASHRARYQAVLHWFAQEETAGRWLLIVDGVDDEVAWWSLRPILPSLTKGAVLVTGCHPAWPGSCGQVVGPFGLEQAREFSAQRMRAVPAGALLAERNAWDRLAEALGRLPLILEVAAAYLREKGQTAREFLDAWTNVSRPPALAHAPSISAMVEHCVSDLPPHAATLLKTLCCLDAQPAAIPIALFEHRGDWPQNNAALEILERRALIVHDESGQTIGIHRMIREIVRDRLSAVEMAASLGAARAELETVLGRWTGGSARDSQLRELLIPHCRALLGQVLGHPVELHASGIARALGDFLKNNGRLREAESFYRRALAIEERRLGPDHIDLAPRLRDLVTILRSIRQLDASEDLSRRLITLLENETPPDDAALAADVAQYAATLRAAMQLEDAEDLCRQALSLTRKFAAPDHPKVALAMHHLACLLEIEHRPRESEPLYRRALTIEERTFGTDHPRLSSRLFHLGYALSAMKRLADAEALFRRGLALDEAHLGADHPDLCAPLDELAAILEDQGKIAEAEKLSKRSLAIHEKAIGPEEPETAMVLTNLGCLLVTKGDLEQAKLLFQRAAAILAAQTRRWRGPHPHLNSSLTNLRRILRATGSTDEEIQEQLRAYRPKMPKRVRSRFLDD